MCQLSVHHKLLNKINELQRQVTKYRNAANAANATKDKNIEKGKRTFKAKLLIELNESGELSWSVHEIAACCHISVSAVRKCQSEVRRGQPYAS